MEPILPSYYRLRLSDALRNRLELPADQIHADAGGETLFSDVLTLRNLTNLPVPLTDPGETKHSPLDKKSLGDLTESSINVRRLEHAADTSSAEHAQRYRENGAFDAASLRRRMEDRVRRSKRAGSECPFRDECGQCSMLFIRCGDRLQFSMRETGSERRFFHKCTYDWRNRGEYILIVDDDMTMQEFCKASFALFLDYDKTKIITTGSVDQAIDILARSKVEGKKCGLVISDIVMPGKNGYDLVNELYGRNFEVEIVLMREPHEVLPEPADYKGTTEVLPNLPYVSCTLLKSFHSETLIREVQKLRVGWGR